MSSTNRNTANAELSEEGFSEQENEILSDKQHTYFYTMAMPVPPIEDDTHKKEAKQLQKQVQQLQQQLQELQQQLQEIHLQQPENEVESNEEEKETAIFETIAT